MRISKEIRVGILVAVAILILLLGFNWLRGTSIFNKGTSYHIFYENANGLQVGDAVLINGLKVGKVNDIQLPEGYNGVDVTINITSDLVIPSDSRAVIGGDLLGEKYIQIALGTSSSKAMSNDTLNGDIEMNVMDQIKQLSGKISIMMASIDTTINVLSSIFTENLRDEFAKSITGIKQTLESFNNSAARFNALLVREEPKIGEIITNVSNVTDYVNKSEVEVKAILANLRSLTDTLNSVEWNELAIELEQAAANISTLTEKINAGDGSLGMLVNDKDLYMKLTETLATLDTVLTEFGRDPQIRLHLFK